MTSGTSQQGGHETYSSTDLHALNGEFGVALLQQEPAADTHTENGTDDPGRSHSVTEL